MINYSGRHEDMVGFHPIPHHFFQKKWTKSVHFVIQDEGGVKPLSSYEKIYYFTSATTW